MSRYLLPLAALGMLLFAVNYVVGIHRPDPPIEIPVEPARAPYKEGVAGAGVVEPETENISVGAYVPGVVVEVAVKVGQSVRVGDLLFRLDDRQVRAELAFRKAALAAAEAQLAKLEQLPRPEELPPAEAKVREAEANLVDLEDQAARARKLFTQRAIGEEEMVRRAQAGRVAREQVARARAEHELLRAGAWEPDKEVSRAAIAQAAAQLAQTATELARLEVRALVAGEVLQVNVRPGEFVGAPPGQALIVLGSLRNKHVRVDIDEHDIPRFRPGSPARAMLRGDPGTEFPLRFVRVEPFVIPKKALTGDNTERVDTRVLQVIFAIEDSTAPVYVGQQVDVYVEGVPRATEAR